MRRSRAGRPAVVHTVTTAPVSVAVDQDVRMKRYLITMGIRTACFVGAWIFEGPVRWAFVVMAVALPYVAVVLANAVGPRWGSRITGADRFTDPTPSLPAGPAVGDPPVGSHRSASG